MLARLIEAGKGRTAGKLRSYLQAAFAQALRAELDPAAPASLLGFHVQANPAAVLPSQAQFNIAGERALSVPELRAYLAALELWCGRLDDIRAGVAIGADVVPLRRTAA